MDHTAGSMLLGLAMVTFGLGASSPVAAREQVPTPQDCAALAVAQGLAIADEAAGEHGQDGRNTARAKQIEPTITSATWVPAAGSVPEYCRVEGYITTGDKHEGFNRVRFAVNLPTHWNGRFVMLGDGGHDGSVSTSTARLPLYHGWGDGLIGPEPTVDYYEGIVQKTFGGDAAAAHANVRLFMVPGMGHCGGGVRGAAVGWDKLAPLVQWVENGQPPDAIVVSQDAATATPQGNQRIVCPWPLQPTYVGPSGGGAENDPTNWVSTNFTCQPQQ